MNTAVMIAFVFMILLILIMIGLLIYQLFEVERLERRIKEKDSDEDENYDPDQHMLGGHED